MIARRLFLCISISYCIANLYPVLERLPEGGQKREFLFFFSLLVALVLLLLSLWFHIHRNPVRFWFSQFAAAFCGLLAYLFWYPSSGRIAHLFLYSAIVAALLLDSIRVRKPLYSEKEKRIIRMVAVDNMSNEEIAASLTCAVGSVKRMLYFIFRKARVETRRDLRRKFRKRFLVSILLSHIEQKRIRREKFIKKEPGSR